MKWQKKGSVQDTWYEKMDDRQLAEVEFARLYAEKFEHGTDGHNRLLLIAKMAYLLDQYQSDLRMVILERERVARIIADLDIEIEQASARGDTFFAERISAYRTKLASIRD